MWELPTSITIQGQDFKITNKGDFRMVLDCFEALDDKDLDASGRIEACLIIFYEALNNVESTTEIFEILPNVEEAAKAMMRFFNCNQESSAMAKTDRKMIDWVIDEPLIAGAVTKVAGHEIRGTYCHWFTFIGYLNNVGEGPWHTVVGIRSKLLTGKPLEKWERKFRSENPQFFTWNSKTTEQQEIDEWVKNLWNK